MALFIVRHQHEPDRCPATDPYMGATLLNYLSRLARVEVSIGGGPWQDAGLVGERKRHSWQGWELLARLEQPGPTSARATDMAGRAQPDLPEWNRLGYANNAIHKIRVDVR